MSLAATAANPVRGLTVHRYAANDEIYGQGDRIRSLYRLTEGAIRTSRVTADGRRQVGEFYYPGDVFGLEAAQEHQFSAEALTECVVEVLCVIAAGDPAQTQDVNPLVAAAARQELHKASEHLLLLGRKSAREKVALFLMAQAERTTHAKQNTGCNLPMGRQDIADYLGLTIETVSRMLTQLQGEAVIEFPAVRRFHIKRWDVLERLAA